VQEKIREHVMAPLVEVILIHEKKTRILNGGPPKKIVPFDEPNSAPPG
jgi:hypothetical protein